MEVNTNTEENTVLPSMETKTDNLGAHFEPGHQPEAQKQLKRRSTLIAIFTSTVLMVIAGGFFLIWTHNKKVTSIKPIVHSSTSSVMAKQAPAEKIQTRYTALHAQIEASTTDKQWTSNPKFEGYDTTWCQYIKPIPNKVTYADANCTKGTKVGTKAGYAQRINLTNYYDYIHDVKTQTGIQYENERETYKLVYNETPEKNEFWLDTRTASQTPTTATIANKYTVDFGLSHDEEGYIADEGVGTINSKHEYLIDEFAEYLKSAENLRDFAISRHEALRDATINQINNGKVQKSINCRNVEIEQPQVCDFVPLDATDKQMLTKNVNDSISKRVEDYQNNYQILYKSLVEATFYTRVPQAWKG